MRLELDLDRWERGDLSAHELVARHGRDEVEGLIAVHARLEDVGAASTPDPDVSWQAFRWQLPTPRSRRRRGRVLALAAALAVGLASMGYAAERLWRPLTRPPAFDLRPPASPSVGASTTPQDPYLFPRPVEDQDEPGDSNAPDGGTDSSDSGTSEGEPGDGGGGSRSEKGGSDDDADEDEDEDQDDDEEEDEHEDERGEDDEDHADADEVDDEGKDDD